MCSCGGKLIVEIATVTSQLGSCCADHQSWCWDYGTNEEHWKRSRYGRQNPNWPRRAGQLEKEGPGELKLLKRQNHQAVNHNNRSGNDRKTFPHLTLCEAVWGSWHSRRPVALCASMQMPCISVWALGTEAASSSEAASAQTRHLHPIVSRKRTLQTTSMKHPFPTVQSYLCANVCLITETYIWKLLMCLRVCVCVCESDRESERGLLFVQLYTAPDSWPRAYGAL